MLGYLLAGFVQVESLHIVLGIIEPGGFSEPSYLYLWFQLFGRHYSVMFPVVRTVCT